MSVASARVALVGAGVIGKRHVEAIKASHGLELVAIADPAPGAPELAAQLGVPHFSEVEAMLPAVQPDGAIVATPTVHHLQPAVACLDAGAHVLVEKPITQTVAEAAILVAKAWEKNLHVLVGHHRRYYACIEQARTIVQGGTLGRLIAINGLWATRKHDDYYLPDWRKMRAAGPVLTNLIHEVDSLRFICGEVLSVCGELAANPSGFEKEDGAAIVLRFRSGAVGTFVLSDQAYSPWSWEQATGENVSFPATRQNTVRFMGSDASLEFPNLVMWSNPDGRPDWHHLAEPRPIPTEFGDAYVAQIAHFGDVIAGRAQPRIDAVDGMRSLAATVAIFDAARSGMRIKL